MNTSATQRGATTASLVTFGSESIAFSHWQVLLASRWFSGATNALDLSPEDGRTVNHLLNLRMPGSFAKRKGRTITGVSTKKYFLHPLAIQHCPITMPLVRIALMKSTPADRGKKIGGAVYLQMVATLNVPPNDNFQVITEHDPNSLIYDPEYLGVARTDGIVIIQITLNEGRTTEMKKAFYAAVAEHLHAELGIRKEDVLITLVEVKKENWSFGNGIAQYA